MIVTRTRYIKSRGHVIKIRTSMNEFYVKHGPVYMFNNRMLEDKNTYEIHFHLLRYFKMWSRHDRNIHRGNMIIILKMV